MCWSASTAITCRSIGSRRFTYGSVWNWNVRPWRIGSAGRVGCWAHVRRKFHDLVEAHQSPIATEALQRIAELYQIEKEIRGRPPDERRQVRQDKTRPLLETLETWFRASLSRLSRKSDVSAA